MSVLVSSSLAAHVACLPRSGSACSTRSVFSAIILARCSCFFTRPRAGNCHSGTTIGWPSASYSGCSVNQTANVVDQRLVAQRIDAAAGDLGDARRLGRAERGDGDDRGDDDVDGDHVDGALRARRGTPSAARGHS